MAAQGWIQEKGKGGAEKVSSVKREKWGRAKREKNRGYTHFQWSKTRENPILSQGKSRLRLHNCYEQSTSDLIATASQACIR